MDKTVPLGAALPGQASRLAVVARLDRRCFHPVHTGKNSVHRPWFPGEFR